MSGDPLVSVVLIFYNDEMFLGEAIDSVFAQTLSDWELLLVDDGSTDGSTAQARQVADAHPGHVRYLDHPDHANRGISATRNRGISDARGRYVAFLDSDDVWLPEKLEEQATLLDAHPEVGLLFGASEYWWSWAGADAPADDKFRPPGAGLDRCHEPPSLVVSLYPLGQGIAPCPSSCIARRDVIERLGGFEDQFRTMYEDQAFLAKAYLDTPVWVSSSCWDRYRRHAGSITMGTGEEDYHTARRKFLRWFGHYLDEGVADPQVLAALERAWWPYRHPHLAGLRRRGGIARAKIRTRLAGRRPRETFRRQREPGSDVRHPDGPDGPRP